MSVFTANVGLTPSLSFYLRFLHDLGGVGKEAGDAFDTALAAVTAERDQARQMLADAPHDKQCASGIPMQFHKPWPCDCWKAGA